jgi:hypothetical protein
VLTLDFHAPGGAEDGGVYSFPPLKDTPPNLQPQVLGWLDRFRSALSPEYAADPFWKIAQYRSRWETPSFTAACVKAMDVASLSLETSYQSARDLVLTIDHYRRIGAKLADAIVEAVSSGA